QRDDDQQTAEDEVPEGDAQGRPFLHSSPVTTALSIALWYLILGGLLIVIALVASVVKHLPLTTTMLYLVVGFVLGASGLRALVLDPLDQARLLEHLTELAVIVSLFTAGLKFRVAVRDPLWRIPIRLATVSMVLTVALIAAVGVVGLGLSLGAAILLGAILAPTDPVLASDVQLAEPGDRDRLRFGLTGEAGLNDGTAFPFVMLGLGLLGLHELGELGWRWVAVDLVWAIAAGLAIGFVAGTLVGRLVLFLRREHKEGFGLDDFLALGLIGLSYGAALAAHSYGFLAVFAAGLALRRVERRHSGEDEPEDVPAAAMLAAGKEEEIATDPEKAPSYMASAVLGFNEHTERILEVGIVLLIGAMLSSRYFPGEIFWFFPLLILGIRPLAVALGLLRSDANGFERFLIGGFGIRGIGSLYYLTFAINHGLDPELARRLTGFTLSTVAASILVHGMAVTPALQLYERRRSRSAER
ncbi:MAG TPA: cation:proton antiporter, partial [Thermoanaerobaculia bacterium]|nr:cation:proton antiporter [Thermoanaerobaculia bacterium]